MYSGGKYIILEEWGEGPKYQLFCKHTPLVLRIRTPVSIHPGCKQLAKIMEKFTKNQPKSQEYYIYKKNKMLFF